ncbi:sin3 histone deacetylase corepressor complex component SDS3-like [Dendronephthya gigantea]|uniref:sin3 histone deacetylase corepressor complex component SDS3-like n=1 Tax=Dendronephthya gigantea TaxID=151771 RepID=UPI00106A8449|nr:sin3 histone deacetylase corepressor complex component SDS3-like [Dendronephthya gigantea]
MAPKRNNEGKNSLPLKKARVRKGRILDKGDQKTRKNSGGIAGKTKRACAKRPRRQSKMATNFDSDENNSDISSEDERGFFQMAESDEDTEDASETDMAKLEEEFSELKEQVYQEKLSKYKKQLQELNNGTQADYLKRLNQLEKERDDRLFLAEVCKMYEIEMINKDCENEKKTAKIEYENKKIELKETLLQQLDEKKKSLELEKVSMELTNDILESKPAVTRKLRRRPNDPPPAPEKRRKNSPIQINFLLDETEMLDDLKAMNKLHTVTTETQKNGSKATKNSNNSDQNTNLDNQVADPIVTHYDIRVEDGKLFFDRRWYHRGQQVYVESKENGKVSGIIHAIGPSEICIKRTNDNSKMRITISQLQKGRYTIRRRSS